MMTYDDGTELMVGDRVLIDSGMTGVVIADIDARLGDRAWFYLEGGLMVDTTQAGLIHYGERPTSLIRQASARA